MILSPDEERSLQVIDHELAAVSPHLAGMLRIFSRLHAHDPAPPVEDAVVAIQPSPVPAPARPSRRWRRRARRQAESWPGATMRRGPARRRAARQGAARRGIRRRGMRVSRQGVLKPLAAIAVPTVVLATLALVVVFGLGSSIRCRPVAASATAVRRTASVPVPAGSGFAACPTSGTTGVTGSPGR
jgi:hypothetical protein